MKKALGSKGNLAAFSFNETKKIITCEGGMLLINDVQFCDRAKVTWVKSTNRTDFFGAMLINMVGSILVVHFYHQKLLPLFCGHNLKISKKFKEKEEQFEIIITQNFVSVHR